MNLPRSAWFFALALPATACDGIGPGARDGAVGSGEAQVDNQSDAQLAVELQ